MKLRQRTALITGAGGPMGAAIARRFAQEGASLILTDISGTRLDAAVESVRSLLADGAKLSARRASVLVREEAAGVVEAGLAEVGPVDILMNIVGGIRSQSLFVPFLDMTEERWDATFTLNLKGGFHMTQLVVPGMIARGWGKVVNISSINFAGASGQSDYGAAKAAVASMTRTLAMEFAPHVNVNCIVPAVIRTSVVERLSEAEQAEWTGKTLIGTFGEADDIASASVFLASDDARYITGELLNVSGGMWPSL